uniref:Phosphatidic acid phosphatase type 2/haloperoxidase domain-containing protein n=1 Tax=Xiphophorus couchianus TaxID=32473 RepID=A0A3B5LZK7_9TELE
MFEASGIPVIFDVVCLVLVGLPFFILTPRHSPFKRGFFCNDESIRFPYKEDTISYQLLLGVMIPFTLILLCGEFLSVYMCRIKSRSLKRKWMMCVYKAVGSSLFGAAASQSLTDIAKYSIGRLRPYFLAVCKPVWNQIDCKTGGYIENFTCFIFEFNLLSFILNAHWSLASSNPAEFRSLTSHFCDQNCTDLFTNIWITVIWQLWWEKMLQNHIVGNVVVIIR